MAGPVRRRHSRGMEDGAAGGGSQAPRLRSGECHSGRSHASGDGDHRGPAVGELGGRISARLQAGQTGSGPAGKGDRGNPGLQRGAVSARGPGGNRKGNRQAAGGFREPSGNHGRPRGDPRAVAGVRRGSRDRLERSGVGRTLPEAATLERHGGADSPDERFQRVDRPGPDRRRADHRRVRHGTRHGQSRDVASGLHESGHGICLVKRRLFRQRNLGRHLRPWHARGRVRGRQRHDVRRQLQGRGLRGPPDRPRHGCGSAWPARRL